MLLLRRNLEAETTDELRERGKGLGIKNIHDMKKEALIASILKANADQNPNEMGQQLAEEEEKHLARVESRQKARKENEKFKNSLPVEADRCWFKVAAGQNANEKSPVFAALNGESVLIKRNHWVKLKTDFLPVFRDAICTEVDIDGQGETHLRNVPRFNIDVRTLAEGKPAEPSLRAGF